MLSQKHRVIVGMSGGVDSSVTALLLKQQGHDVRGLFMQNWDADQDDPYCSISQDMKDAHAVCEQIGIPFDTVRFTNEYWERVFKHFLDEYAAGRTPNPDILCNKEIKFKAFLDHALSLGADYIATGHYAINFQDAAQNYHLYKSHDLTKDQSYFLYTLQQPQLARSLFPLGEYQKSAVRQIARDHCLKIHAKKDSTGICFIGERKFKTFLNEFVLARPGNMETPDGKIVGQHDGLMFYTLGQRQGLGIGGMKDTEQSPWYVLQKDLARNTLIVGQSHDHPLLLTRELTCEQLHWVIGRPPAFPLNCSAKTRYRQQDEACTIDLIDKLTAKVVFSQPQWAVTPGQSVVFYQGQECLGGGVIK